MLEQATLSHSRLCRSRSNVHCTAALGSLPIPTIPAGTAPDIQDRCGLLSQLPASACGGFSCGYRFPSPQAFEIQLSAYSKLYSRYQALYKSDDFKEGRKAEAEGRPPVYTGK
jgi:hypothetical protein